VGEVVREYYFVLRCVLKTKPHLRRCLARCRHCRIFFLTHPRNAGRTDLGCPFGCSQAHRKQRSSERSTAYYRTAPGREKKRIQNAKRRPGEAKAGSRKEVEKTSPDLELDGRIIDGGMVAYVGVVTSLIEGREIPRDEIVAMLRRAVRQHSISREKRIDYVLRYLNENPP
jgi:hypothetical protein